jgi:hypothetical protein
VESSETAFVNRRKYFDLCPHTTLSIDFDFAGLTKDFMFGGGFAHCGAGCGFMIAKSSAAWHGRQWRG